MGEHQSCSADAHVLNISVNSGVGKGVALESGLRHVRVMVEEMQCSESKPLAIPAVKRRRPNQMATS